MKKNYKYGRLYRFFVDAVDIDKILMVRVMRKLNIKWFPIGLRNADALYLREDHSPYSRFLVEKCKKYGVTTYVVQEGATDVIKNPTGHAPLHADVFLCPKGMKKWWVEQGMDKSRIREFIPTKEAKYCSKIAFLHPFYLREDYIHTHWGTDENIKTMKIITNLLLDEDVCFSLHNKNRDVMERFIPKHRIVYGKAEDLIPKYKTVYSFYNSTIVRDCERLGVTPMILE